MCAILFVAAFVVRASLIPHINGDRIQTLVKAAPSVMLILSCSLVCFGRIRRINLACAGLLLATAASLWNCDRLDYVLPRWVGWTAVIAALGPFIYSQRAVLLRRWVRHYLENAQLAVILLSFLWWIGGLPNLGAGNFTGVMWHSMMLGALAALVGIRSLTKGLPSRDWRQYGLFAICFVLVLLASSRVALAAFLAGSLIVLALGARRRPAVSWLLLMAAAIPSLGLAVTDSAVDLLLPSALTSGLQAKEFVNTREKHWEARWEEFVSAPLTGIGFSSAWDGAAGFNVESGAVETGSSYLQVLSMTGVLGAAGLLGLVAVSAWRIHRNWHRMTATQQMQVCGFACFWCVHLGAEGYLYAVSSLLNMTFWLWLGGLHDLALSFAYSTQTATKRPFRAVVRPRLARPISTLAGDLRT
jgi:O-antigen ligase